MPPEPLVTLEEKLNPAWTALVCIDYQNDFCAEGGALDRCGFDVKPMAAIAPTLGRFIDGVRETGVPVIFVGNTYATKENWYLSDVVLSQTRRHLRGLYHDVPLCEPGTWGREYSCGVTTNVCVESTTRHAYFKDYYCVVPSDGVAAYGEDLHAMALKNIDFLFGEVAASARVLQALRAARGWSPGPTPERHGAPR